MSQKDCETTKHRDVVLGQPDSEVVVAIPAGSTGYWPVPSGDPPLGTGSAHELFHRSVSSANLLPVPAGQWPDGTGGSPVPPIPTSEFGLNDANKAGRRMELNLVSCAHRGDRHVRWSSASALLQAGVARE